MFGMLDYRAYKLFWLIGFPLRVVNRFSFFAIIGIAVLIALQTSYVPLVKMGIAYGAMEGILLVFLLAWWLLIAWPIDKAFFWVVDVVPSRGEDKHEAKEIVRRGPAIWLSKKLMNDIEHWTFEDTEEFTKCLNWRSRLFFKGRERVAKRASVLKDEHWRTGKQPAELGDAEIKKLLQPYKDNWLETIIMSPQGWNAIVGATVIIFSIMYMAQPH
jgi:hypothetical protein